MEPFIGQVVLFAGNFAPRSWAFCDGQLLAISSNTALFSILGTMYGGDGRTSFALPDLRGRTPRGPRSGPGLQPVNVGERGGREDVTLTVSNLPSHNHALLAEDAPGAAANPVGRMLGRTGSAGPIYVPNGSAADNPMDSRSIGNSGGSQSFDNLNPFLGLNYIIALQGTFPSRS